jgi:hypothetical protein
MNIAAVRRAATSKSAVGILCAVLGVGVGASQQKAQDADQPRPIQVTVVPVPMPTSTMYSKDCRLGPQDCGYADNETNGDH